MGLNAKNRQIFLLQTVLDYIVGKSWGKMKVF